MLDASPSFNDYVNLQVHLHDFVPNSVIEKGEESSPPSFLPLSTHVTIPQSYPLNTEEKKKFNVQG